MSSCVSQSFQVPSPLKMIPDSFRRSEKQGIVAILGSDSERTKMEPSLRRTLSADMSSQKWVSHMKKVASSEEISASIVDGSEYADPRGELEIWNSIQEEKKKKDAAQSDIWSSIISQKDVNSSKSIPPYIHHLVKRSASSLCEKSLEICTESLGSETGSDGFSSNTQSENGDDDKEANQNDETQAFEQEEWRPVKYNYKKSRPQSFPPPLLSLSCPDGGSLRMQPRRNNGRLVLEAMAVPSQNNFRAQRQDGRLVLTLVNPQFIEQVVSEEEKQEDEFDNTFAYSEDDEEETEEEETEEDEQEREGTITEKAPEFSSGSLNVHRLAVMMNRKSILLANLNQSTPIAHSLPPRPKVAQPTSYSSPPSAPTATAAASLNAYEYYWRSKPTTKAAIAVNPLAQQPQSFKNSSRKLIVCKNRTANEQQQLMPSNGSCKEVRRSLLFWEPHCIATS